MKESDRTAYLFLPGGLGTMVCAEHTTCVFLLCLNRRMLSCRAFPSFRAAATRHPAVPGKPAHRCALALQDELFEILTLVQLKKLGSKYPVPVVLVDYDGFYGGLLQVRLVAALVPVPCRIVLQGGARGVSSLAAGWGPAQENTGLRPCAKVLHCADALRRPACPSPRPRPRPACSSCAPATPTARWAPRSSRT